MSVYRTPYIAPIPHPASRPAQHLVPEHRPGLALTPSAGGKYEVFRAMQDRTGDAGDEVAPVSAIAVHEDNHPAGRVGGLRAERTSPAVATPGVDHPCAGGPGNVLRAIGATAIGDDDVSGEGRRDLPDDGTNRIGLVQRRDDEAYRLHRMPQFWHGAGGVSDRSEVRKSRYAGLLQMSRRSAWVASPSV